ncbi:ferritin-like domain-containing protein [Citreimonas salinaria]|uniref:Ferritin-like metal-binding protein YciE n=1 Tax=Citreimonas salinaria TaxID=321339 RepID=A0A1H3NE77_9RHOB|nr:DUF892 family protein [Citreimonas salinaria]SDY87043.1 Ferritin-like metal-binding protein YciE [Citreimonas salinaria]
MNISDLRTLYVTELQEARSMEELLAEAMPQLAEVATDPQLKDMLREDVDEVRSQVERLAQIIDSHGAEPYEHRDNSMATICAEAEKWAGMIDDAAVRDAAIIASAQRVQHYEIAVYGSLATWAKQLGLDELDTLVAILDEEKGADDKLTEIAKGTVNPGAPT